MAMFEEMDAEDETRRFAATQLDAAFARIGLSHEPPDQEARMAINKYPHSILRIHAFVQKRKGPRRHGPQEEDRKAG